MQFNTLEVPLDHWQCTLEPTTQYRSSSGESLIFMRDKDEKAQLEEDRRCFDRYFRPSWDLRTVTGRQALYEVQTFVSHTLNLAHWNLPTDNKSIERILRQAVEDRRLVPVVHRDRRSALGRVYRPAPAPLHWPSSSGGDVNTRARTFHQMAMDSMGLDADEADAYIERYNAMVQRVDDMAAARAVAKARDTYWRGAVEAEVGAVSGSDDPNDDVDMNADSTDVRASGNGNGNGRDISTALDDAPPFGYSPELASGDPEQIAGMPFHGTPGTWISSMPGTMPQMRQFGSNGTPLTDLDFEAHHGNPDPHAHNWSGYDRDEGAPVLILPW